MEIYKHELADILQSLPDPTGLDAARLANETDLVICTMGFEDRSGHVATTLSSTGNLTAARLLLIEYPTNPKENARSLPAFEAATKMMAGSDKIPYSRYTILPSIRAYLAEHHPRRVVFDISTCSSYVFYPVMKALVDADIQLHLAYVSANEYFPTQAEWELVARQAARENRLIPEVFENVGFQSQGVDEVYSGSYFAEMNCDNRPSALVAVPNFSALRMNAILSKDKEVNKTAFENTIWVIGEPPAVRNKWRVEAVKKTNNLEKISGGNITGVSTLNYKKMTEKLEEVWLQRHSRFYLSIGTLGSKMQHLGTFFFLWMHPDAGIWLAEPSRFQAASFSKGVDQAQSITLGDTTGLREELRKYRQYRLTW